MNEGICQACGKRGARRAVFREFEISPPRTMPQLSGRVYNPKQTCRRARLMSASRPKANLRTPDCNNYLERVRLLLLQIRRRGFRAHSFDLCTRRT